LSNSPDINKNGNGPATNYENIDMTRQVLLATTPGISLSVPEDLRNICDPAISGRKVNIGQYLTTGHCCYGAVCILFPCQLSREKRSRIHYFYFAGININDE
jgi:hypothetical protein